MKKLITLLILAISLIAGTTYGQVSGYAFSQTTGSYTEITGGTLHGSGSGLDDGVYTSIPIGFNFLFNNNTISTLTLSCNGWVNSGYAGSLGYTPISSSTAAVGVVSAMGQDLQGIDANTELRSELTGSAPNRVYTVQWKNFKRYGSSYNGMILNFQIKFHETSNKIDIVYGPITQVATSQTYQVGLRGATNADFNNRTTTTNWLATTAGASNSASCTMSTTTTNPTSGLTFTYTPPTLLPPGGFLPVAVSTTQINLPFTLNLAGNPVVIVWNSTGTFTTPSGAPPAVGSSFAGGTVLYYGSTSPVQHTGLTANTLYYYKAFSYDPALVAYSGGATASVRTPCDPSPLPYNESFESITAANTLPACMAATNLGSYTRTFTSAYGSYNAYAHTGNKFGAFYYGCNDYFFSAPVYLTAGQPYLVGNWYITDGYSGWNTLQLMIHNAQNAAGMVATIATVNNPTNTTYQQLSGMFTPATSGFYYVALYCSSNYVPYYLSVDDITIEALVAPSCPINFSPVAGATNVVRNGLISWSNGGAATDYDVYFGTTSNPPFVGNVTTTSYNPGVLNANTTYYYKIVGHNVLGYSTGCVVNSFTTGTRFTYCASNATYSGDEVIQQVILNTINNTSGTGCAQYTNFTNLSTDLLTSFTYPLTVVKNTCGGNYTSSYNVYIDWNQNGVFDVPNEIVASGSGMYVSGQPQIISTNNITVPLTALPGQTTMRIVLVETSASSYVNPCGTYSWGETEDYSVNVVPYNKDLAVVSWDAPKGACNMTNSETVKVTYQNKGLQTQNDYYLSYYNGSAWTSEHVTTPINPGQTLQYTFATAGDFFSIGEHVCKAAVTLTDDVVRSNDTIKNVKVRNYPSYVVTDVNPYFTNFDGTDPYWYSDGQNNDWVIATPAKSFLSGAASAPKAWVTKATGNYTNNQFSWVESPCYDFSALLNPMVQFDIKYQTESNWDGALLAVSTDEVTWHIVGSIYQATNWYNDTCAYGYPVWGGTSTDPGYITSIHQLNGMAGQPHVKLRMYFIADEAVNFEGVAFDNFKVFESQALFASATSVNIEGVAGDTIDLKIKGGQPPYHVKWSPATGLSCNVALCGPVCDPTTCQKPIATPPVTTTYIAKVWDSKTNKSGADTVFASATVYVYPELTVNAQYNSVVCDQNNTQLYAMVQGGVPPYTYVWDNAATLSNPSIYNPVSTANATTTYHVTVTDNIGFSATSSVTVTTVSGYAVVDINPNAGEVCLGDSIQLTATGGLIYHWVSYPAGQYISNPNTWNPWVKPTVNGTKYTVTVQSPCGVASDFVIINVKQRPVVSFNPIVPGSMCIDANPVTLSTGIPAGGTYSGAGVSGGVFYPSLAGAGTHVITYSYINPAVNNCPGYAYQTITVWPLPAMFINFKPNAYCIDHAPVALTGGLPAGGVYTGTGVTSNVFNPAVAGLGAHAITYTYTDVHGCVNSLVDTLYVNPLPVVTLGSFANVCVNGGTVTLTGGLPAGGVYSGVGVSGTVFNPATAGVGTFTITYTYTDPNGCTSHATSTITVLPLPYILHATSAPADATICNGGSASYSFDLYGTAPWTINWQINGVEQTPIVVSSGNTLSFNLSPTISSYYTISHVSDGLGCGQDQSFAWNVFVNPNPLPYNVTMNDPDGHYCANTGGIAVGLSGSETGVTYHLYKDGVNTGVYAAGTGSAFYFVPNQTADGNYTVVAVSDLAPTHCSTNMTGSVNIVTDNLNVSLYSEQGNAICLGGTTVIDAVINNPSISAGPYSFNWSPTGAPEVSPNGYGSVLFAPTASKYMNVTVSDPAGCTGTQQLYITVNIPAEIHIAGEPTISICDGQEAALNVYGYCGSSCYVTDWEWSPTTDLTVIDWNLALVSPSVATTYTVTITDDLGCQAYSSINVEVTTSPNVEFTGGNVANICPGGSVQIPLLTPTTGVGPFTYAWSSSPAGFTSTSQQPLVYPSVSTVYTVTVYGANCYRTGTYTVNINTPPTVALEPTFNVCNGSYVNLFADITGGGTAPFNFNWTANPAVVFPASMPHTQNPSFIPQPNTTTVFTVTAVDAFGCTGTASTSVTTGTVPTAHAGADVTICEGQSTILTASGGGLYQWFVSGNPVAISPVTNNPSLTVSPTTTTTYEVRVTSACGAAVSFVTVTVNPATVVSVVMPQTTVCQNSGMINLIGIPTDSHGVFTGTGVTDNGDGTGTFSTASAGSSVINYTYTNQYGCSYTAVVEVSVLPAPSVSLPEVMSSCFNTAPFTLTGGVPAGGVYAGAGVSGGQFNAAIAGIGTHTITYTVTDGNNCSSVASSVMTVNSVPEVFTVSVDNNGHYCNYIPAPGVHVRLSGSEGYMTGVVYRLILDGTFTGIAYPGTGGPIDFGYPTPQTATGTYTVEAVYPTGCSVMMTGSATVVIDPLPLVYSVTGGGSYCQSGQGATGDGIAVGLDNSNEGVTYELYLNGSLVSSQPGVNGILSFGNQIGAGTYTVVAVDNISGCRRDMDGYAKVVVLPLPFKYFVSFNGPTSMSFCHNTPSNPVVVTIRQNASECGVDYVLYYNGAPFINPNTGLPMKKTCQQGPSLTWKNTDISASYEFPAGLYTVRATRQNAPYYCYQTMNGGANLSYYESPAIAVQAQDVYIDENQNASFTVNATGSNLLYQWQESADHGTTWHNVVDGAGTFCSYSGAQSNYLSLTNCAYGMTRYQYKVIVTGNCPPASISQARTLYIDPVLTVNIGEVNACTSNNILVPIVFHNADSINAISLTIYYDNTNFTYTGYTNLNPMLAPFQLSVFAVGNRIGISYFDVTNTINSGHSDFNFLDLKFNGLNASGTCHNLWFDLNTQGACELTKISGDILTTSFVNGSACVIPLPVITSAYQSPAEVCADNNVYLFANATHSEGVTYAWTGPNGFTSSEQNPVIYNAQPNVSGVYTLTVTTNVHHCVATTTVNVVVHPRPVAFNVIRPNGDSIACAGSGVEIGLNNSEPNTTYQLFYNGGSSAIVTVNTLNTSGPITFGPQAVSGNYTVLATNQWGCTRWMNGNPHIQIAPLPLWFYVQGGGHYCYNGTGREIHINGSQIGVMYTLLLNACCCQADSIIATLPGTGSPLSFGLHTLPGYYSVVAVNPTTGCQNNMIGCIPIIIDPLPTGILSGGSSVCKGTSTTIHLQLTGKAPWVVSINGTNYNVPTASYNLNVTPLVTTTYTLGLVTDANGCSANGTGTATVTVWNQPEVSVANSGAACVGGTVTLTANATGNGPFTYLWSNGATTSVLTFSNVTASNAGVYTVTVTDAHGCFATSHGTVVVNQPPSVNASGSAACIGGTLTLGVYALGNGPFGYSWTGPNGFTANTENVTLGNATTAMAGIYTVVITDANGCVSTTTAVLTVYDLPVVTASSNSPVCVGSTIALSASATGFGTMSYSWTGPEMFTSNMANPTPFVATMAKAGTYSVLVYDEHQCSNTGSTTVVVNPLPEVCTITGGGVFCFGCVPPPTGLSCSQVGVNYQLLISSTPEGTYVPHGNVVAGTGAAITFGGETDEGYYKILAINAATGCSVMMSGMIHVIVQAPPTATLTGVTICAGQEAVLPLALTGDSYWHVIISDGVNKDTIYVNSGVTGVTTFHTIYIPGTGAHILAPTATTTYTVLLVTDAVCYNTGNSATVTVNPNPTKFALTGGGYYCNGVGVYVGLNGSQVGVNYTLRRNGTDVTTVAGTGAAITFGPQPDGSYTAYAVYAATGCSSEMNGQVVVLPDPGLTGYEVAGGGSYCVGGAGVTVTLSGSQYNKEYKLLLGNIYTGTTVIGTGYPISFTGILTPGVYTVVAYDPITTCTRNMTGSATVVVRPLPTAAISGSATICYGQSVTLHVDLTGTAPYTFVIGDGFSSKVHHTSNIHWDTIVTPATSVTYTISTVVDAYCQNTGTGSAVVVVNSPNQFVVTGGGYYCAGGQGVVVGLTGSQTGVNYALYLNNVYTGVTLAGTGNPLSFGNQTIVGVYTVIATSTSDNCSRTMNGTALVNVNPLPTSFNVTGGGNCCLGCTHVFVCLSGSQYNVDYELYINGVATGIVKHGNGQQFCYDYATVGGTYTIKATNTLTGCWTWMNGSANVVIYPTAQANISGNSTICGGGSANITVTFTAGTAPFSFGLSNGTSVTTYTGIVDNPHVITVTPTATTNYTLAWVSDTYGCYNAETTGVATVTVTSEQQVTIPTYPGMCIEAGDLTLTGGLPAGGVYSGVGVTNGVFSPVAAGVGSHVITYTYTSPNGCQGYAYSTIYVYAMPVVSFIGLDLQYCIDAQPVLITGNHAPYGHFAGPGITDHNNGTATFNPATAGVGGPYTITYTYTDGNQCSASASAQTTVVNKPNVWFTGLASSYCLNSGVATLTGFPAGGVFSGVGIVNGNQFDPALAGVSTTPYVITYTYSTGLCSNSYTQTVSVLPLPNACDFFGGGVCCIGCNVKAYLACSTPGFSYQLVRNGTLFSGNPKVGTGQMLEWEIFIGGTYTVIATNLSTGCTNTMNGTVTVTIIPPPEATLTGSTSICAGQCATLTANMIGNAPFELWFTDGIDTVVVHNINATSWDTLVCPSATTTYRIVNVSDLNCTNFGTGSATVLVNPIPTVFDVTGGGVTCAGTGVEVGLSGSQAGVHYDLYLDGISTGTTVIGNGNPISFGLQSAAGMYTVRSLSIGTCQYEMNGYATVVNIPQTDVTIASLNNVCIGSQPFTLTGGLPVGGVYAVDGILTDIFDPAMIGVGTHTVEYTFTNGYGCSNSATTSITVYALPYVNLAPVTGVCFGSPAFDLTGGTPYGGTYMVNGVVATNFDPSMYGVGSYNLTYEYTDNNGCSATAQATIVVNALPNVTLAQFANVCQGTSAFVLSGGSPANGEYSGPFVTGGMFNPSTAGTYEITYTYTSPFGCTGVAVQTIVVDECSNYSITGNVSYDNTANTAMTNVTVYLKQGSVLKATTTTDASGNYAFNGVSAGTYTIEAASSKPWGGVNSNDALLIMKHFANISPLTGLRLQGANVNGDATVNSIDALLVAKRFVNQIHSFVVGDWTFQVGNVTVAGGDANHNFKALCFGDVNGSYTPPYVKTPATVNLNVAGTKEIKSFQSFELPINISGQAKVGAISLVMSYPENLYEVEGVQMSTTGDFLYTTINGELRISFYNTKETTYSDETIMTLKLKAKNISGASNDELALTLDGISEFGDKNAAVIQNVNLTYPKLTVASNEFSMSNYPNPFRSVTEIVYNLPEAGKVNLTVYNLLGEQVAVLVENVEQSAATYKVNFDGSNLVPGIYTYKLEVKGQKDYTKSAMMVLSK